MSVNTGLFTSEAVSAGHPDKLCDRISDAILDEFLKRDPDARVACETLATEQRIIVSGEFRTRDPAWFDEVKALAPGLIRELLLATGYNSAQLDIDPATCTIELLFNQQSPQIAAEVDQASEVLGAGDQGLMFGYACDETPELMPLAWSLATDLVAEATELSRGVDNVLRADGKSQVTVRYELGRIVGVQCVVLSWQHQPGVSLVDLRHYLTRRVIDSVIPPSLRTDDFRCLVNPAGSWTIGGPKGDTGLTGRKIIVDSYGGACPHGGGAFSGKDPSKVDRSGAYAARWVAKNIVAAGLAQRCTVQLAYAIGYTEPVSINVNSHGTSRRGDEWLTALVAQQFDLSPAAIIRDLRLKLPIYRDTAVLGHFGRHRNACPWEDTAALTEAGCQTLVKDKYLRSLKRQGLASPAGHAWEQLRRLAEKDAKGLPVDRFPTPFVLHAHDNTSAAQKHQRLAEQLDWAERYRCLDTVLNYLCRLPANKWVRWDEIN